MTHSSVGNRVKVRNLEQAVVFVCSFGRREAIERWPTKCEIVTRLLIGHVAIALLSICSSRLQAIATCPIKSRVTISHLVGQRSIASRRPKLQTNTTACSRFLTLTRLPTDECASKSLWHKQHFSKLPITRKSISSSRKLKQLFSKLF